MKNRVNKENFITIQGWMVTDLKLKNNELLVYAIICGFSQTEGQYFEGSLQYLADWTSSTKQGVLKNLKSLLEKKYIVKKEIYKDGVKYCKYRTTRFNEGIKQSLPPIKQSLTGYETKFNEGIKQSLNNNIDNNIEENIENDFGKINGNNVTQVLPDCYIEEHEFTEEELKKGQEDFINYCKENGIKIGV